MMKRLVLTMLVFICASTATGDIRGEVKSYWRVQTDTRARISWNEETLALTYNTSYGQVGAVADGELSFLGVSQTHSMEDLLYLERIDPFRIRLNDLFVLINDFPYSGAYLKVGRQIRKWGSADAFNPTDLLNPYTLEDPLDFGESMGNEMIVLSLPLFDDFALEMAYIPYFRPAQLPESALKAVVDSPQTPRPLKEYREKFAPLEKTLGIQIGDVNTRVNLPARDLSNSMVGVRLSGNIMGVDIAVSYFRGYEDMPYPDDLSFVLSTAGTSPVVTVYANLRYPRIQALGFDMATSLEFLDGMGLWVEGALYFPESYTITVLNKGVSLLEGAEVMTLLSENYWKLTAGIDYTFPGGTYINVQFLHGFFDEIGKDVLKNYIFVIGEHSFWADRIRFRLTGGYCISDNSSVLLPEVSFFIEDAVEIRAGTFLLQGDKTNSKFGHPSAGGDQAFLSVAYRF